MSSFRRGYDDEDASLFEQAMREVDRLPEGKDRVPGRRRVRRRSSAPVTRPTRFRVERRGEHLEGLAPGADRRLLHRLRDGDWPVDLTSNIRRLREAVAREAVSDVLGRAIQEGRRCVLIVHGRGLRSPDGPVLKAALPSWLSERPHGQRVLAFISAPPSMGGTGATLVLLRKSRR